jgi:copper chaperone CopZ
MENGKIILTMAHSNLHHVPGRLRLRCPSLKRNPIGAGAVVALLEDMDGIQSCEVNPLTGSLTVGYDRHQLDGQRIIALLHQHGYCQAQAHAVPAGGYAPVGTHTALDGIIGSAGSTLGKVVIGTLVEKAVERSAVALIAALW